MSTDGPNFMSRAVSRVAARIARGLRAARRPWVVAVGLVYFAGDLWCIAGRNDWPYSMTGRLVRSALFNSGRTTTRFSQEAIVTLPRSPAEAPAVLVPSEQSWDEAARLLRDPDARVAVVHAISVASSSHIHARAIGVLDWRVLVNEMRPGIGLTPDERDRVVHVVREWNKTCEARLGLRPIDVDPKRVATIHPLGILHNALSLVVLVLVANAVPSATIGAWRRRRTARRIARGQCAMCGYEFGAASIDRCPECGEARAGGET